MASGGAPSRPSRRQQEVTVPGASRMRTALALHSHLSSWPPELDMGSTGLPPLDPQARDPWASCRSPGAPTPTGRAPYRPREQSPAPSRLSGPNFCLSKAPRQCSASQLSPKSPGRVVNTKATFSVLPKTYRTVSSIFCIWLSLMSC